MTNPECRTDRPDPERALLHGGVVAAELQPVAIVLTDLRGLIPLTAPTPTPELASLLAQPSSGAGLLIDLAARRSRRTLRVGATLALATVTVLGSVGVAAAHGSLPRAAQNAVADAVTALTPFAVPRADLPGPIRVRPAEPVAHAPAVEITAPHRVVPATEPSSRRAEGKDEAVREGSRPAPDSAQTSSDGREAGEDGSRPGGSSPTEREQAAGGPDRGDTDRARSGPEPRPTSDGVSAGEREPAAPVSDAPGHGDGGSAVISGTTAAPDPEPTGSGTGDISSSDPATLSSGDGGSAGH